MARTLANDVEVYVDYDRVRRELLSSDAGRVCRKTGIDAGLDALLNLEQSLRVRMVLGARSPVRRGRLVAKLVTNQ